MRSVGAGPQAGCGRGGQQPTNRRTGTAAKPEHETARAACTADNTDHPRAAYNPAHTDNDPTCVATHATGDAADAPTNASTNRPAQTDNTPARDPTQRAAHTDNHAADHYAAANPAHFTADKLRSGQLVASFPG